MLPHQQHPCQPNRTGYRPPLQELTRGNLLGLAVGAACTVWLYDFLYEEREAQQVCEREPVEVRMRASVGMHRLALATSPSEGEEVLRQQV